MKVYQLFLHAEKMWPYFNSFPVALEKVDVNVDNIFGEIYFFMLNLKCKEWQLLLEMMASIPFL